MRTLEMTGFGAFPAPHGIGTGNFAIGATMGLDGRLFECVTFNPSTLGTFLRPVAGPRIYFRLGDTRIADAECAEVTVDRAWPFQRATYRDPRLGAARIEVELFAPIAYDDEFTSSIPAVFSCFRVFSEEGSLPMIEIDASDSLDFVATDAADTVGVHDSESCIIMRSLDQTDASHTMLETGFLVQPVVSGARINIAISYADAGNRIAAADMYPKEEVTSTARNLAAYALENYDQLHRKTCDLESRLPFSGDAVLDENLRWYATAAVLLTRILRDGTVLTLGYRELNQRDSYWTSWMHLQLWPTLDRRMIEISAAHQQDNGRVPTCILPTIERPDDLDIQLYFIMRIFRYADHYKDAAYPQQYWPQILRALAFMESCNLEGDGIPAQRSFWGDWKDVPGVTGRKYAPHVCLLYIAVLQRTMAYAASIADANAEDMLRSRLEAAQNIVNAPLEEGGLWNGRFYEQRWYDDRTDGRLLQDQFVGPLYNAVPKDRAASILDSLQESFCDYGVRETWPYWPDAFGNGAYHRGGQYHNGGIWPWLCFAHAMALIEQDRAEEARALMRLVGDADLRAQNDWSPNEFIDAETGENKGPSIQGWGAACYGAMMMLAQKG